MVWPVVAAVAAGVLMDEYNKAQTAGDDRKAKQLLDQIMTQYQGMEAPEYSAPDLQGLSYQDTVYNPITSKWEDVASDPAMMQKQQAALSALDQISRDGGMTLTDQANLSDIQGQAAMQDKGRRDAIRQNMQMQGMGGSGMDLLSELQSSQAATNQANQGGMQVAGQAQQRALDAIMQGGQLAGDIRQQGFGEQAQKAQAQDAIAQFNANNLMQNQQFNKGMGMDTQKYNVDIANQTAQMPNALKQQSFADQMAIAQGKAGALGKGADWYSQRAGQKSQATGNIISGGIQGLSAYYGAKK